MLAEEIIDNVDGILRGNVSIEQKWAGPIDVSTSMPSSDSITHSIGQIVSSFHEPNLSDSIFSWTNIQSMVTLYKCI